MLMSTSFLRRTYLFAQISVLKVILGVLVLLKDQKACGIT